MGHLSTSAGVCFLKASFFFHSRLLPGTGSPAVGPAPCEVQVPLFPTLDILRRDLNKPKQSHASYEASALPPSQHGWATSIVI